MTLLTRSGMLAIHSLCMVPLLNILLSQVGVSEQATPRALLFHNCYFIT